MIAFSRAIHDSGGTTGATRSPPTLFFENRGMDAKYDSIVFSWASCIARFSRGKLYTMTRKVYDPPFRFMGLPLKSVNVNVRSVRADELILNELLYMKSFGRNVSVDGIDSFACKIAGTAIDVTMDVSSANSLFEFLVLASYVDAI